MAKKKSKKTVTHRRRRRSRSHLGALKMGSMDLMGAAVAVGLGMVLPKIDSFIPGDWDPKMKAGAKIGIGFAIANFLKQPGQTGEMIKAGGLVLMASGGTDLGKAMGFLSAGEDDLLLVTLGELEDDAAMNGTDDVPVLSGNDVPILSESVLGQDILG